MNGNVLKIVKIVISVASLGLSVVSSVVAKKELDETVAKKVAEALANQAGKEA